MHHTLESGHRVAFAKEPLSLSLFEESLPLIRAHWAEVAPFEEMALEPDFNGYLKAEAAGALRAYTARHEATGLIGYALFVVNKNLNSRHSLQAVQSALFISKDHRGFGRAFLDWCDAQLAEEGVEYTLQNVTSKHDFGPMLESLGYKNTERVFTRRLRWAKETADA